MFSLINDRINSWWFYHIGTDWNSSESRSIPDDSYIIWVALIDTIKTSSLFIKFGKYESHHSSSRNEHDSVSMF